MKKKIPDSKGKYAMEKITLIFLGIVILFYIAVYFKKPSLAIAGLRTGGINFLRALPLIVFAFILGGILQVLVPVNSFSGWLGSQKGFKAVIFGCLLGGITPGPIYVVFPIAFSLLKGGASVGAVIAYIVAWQTWPVRRLPIEISLLGWQLALIEFILVLPLSIIAGLLANLFFSKVIFF
ncbi:MAG: permease [Candidatus Omnitrophica bacterium]|nr:permease [Candidatus Omnitrophota bacterium]